MATLTGGMSLTGDGMLFNPPPPPPPPPPPGTLFATSGGAEIYKFNMDGSGETSWTSSVHSANPTEVFANSTKVAVGYPSENRGKVSVFNHDGTGETVINGTSLGTSAQFGSAIAMTETKMVIGAFFNNNYNGAIYVCDLDGSNMVQINNAYSGTMVMFGRQVAINDTKVYAGAPGYDTPMYGTGYVAIYNHDGTGRTFLQPTGTNNNSMAFGEGIWVTDDYLYVTAQYSNLIGAIFRYELSNGVPVQASQVTFSRTNTGSQGGEFLSPIAVNTKVITGSQLYDYNSLSNSGAGRIYDLDGSNDSFVIPSDVVADGRFGKSVAQNSTKLAFGSNKNAAGGEAGYVYLYDTDGSNEIIITPSTSSGTFGGSIHLLD